MISKVECFLIYVKCVGVAEGVCWKERDLPEVQFVQTACLFCQIILHWSKFINNPKRICTGQFCWQ